jgi:hypothetical protein
VMMDERDRLTEADLEYRDAPAPAKHELDDLVRELANAAREVPDPPSVEGRQDLVARLGMSSPEELASVLGLQPSQVHRYLLGQSNGDGVISGNVLRRVDAATRGA